MFLKRKFVETSIVELKQFSIPCHQSSNTIPFTYEKLLNAIVV